MCIHFLVLQCGPQSVPLPHPFLSVCSTVLQRAPPLLPVALLPRTKRPSLSFQGGVLALRCLCCRCHLPPLLFCRRSPMAQPPVMAGVPPHRNPGVQRLLQSQHKHLTDPRKSENTSVAAQKKTQTGNAALFSSSRKADVCSVFCLELLPPPDTFSVKSKKKLAELFKM